MTHKHEAHVPAALESLVTGLADLEVVLGKNVAPVIAAVRTGLIAAMAARDHGDVPGAVAQISTAMDQLTAVADQLDPAEAGLMRAMAQHFRAALARGNTAEAQQSAAVMLQKSGAVERKKI